MGAMAVEAETEKCRAKVLMRCKLAARDEEAGEAKRRRRGDGDSLSDSVERDGGRQVVGCVER